MDDCPLCERCLETQQGLHQHLQSKHPKLYCDKCQRSFSSTSAKRQHLSDSQEHHVCESCAHRPDFSSEAALSDHLEAKHNYCTSCECAFATPAQLVEHDISEHHMCEECGRYFQSSSNLSNYIKTHAPNSITCPGCHRKFISNSAMLLHLETGSCISGTDCDRISEIAFDCYESGEYSRDDDREFDFECPNCETPFFYMSGLLQHSESEACNMKSAQKKSLNQFMNYLRTQV